MQGDDQTVFTTQAVSGADEVLAALIDGGPAAAAERVRGHRGLMAMIKAAVVCSLSPTSRWSGRDEPLRAASGWLTELENAQGPSGLFTSGDNVDSPPDSSFTLNDLAVVHTLLTGQRGWEAVRSGLAEVACRAADAVLTGGVHTPNHRWEIASALAGLAQVLGDDRCTGRARQWLAEGVDVDPDGIYSERSANYAAHVSNPSLLTLADALGEDSLREVVHRNLHAMIDLTDAGEVETVHSRRQDQRQRFPIGPFAMQWRRFAVAGCRRCAHACGAAQTAPGFDPVDALAQLLAEPALGADVETGPPPEVRRTFELGLRRRRDAQQMSTVYAGSDVARSGRIASGLACNPTVLRYRYGAALLDSVRLSRDFFGLGPFRPSQWQEIDGGLLLVEELTTGYYQPLPPDQHRFDGRYDLEFEGRFAAAMNFSRRPVDTVRLRTELGVREEPDGLRLDLSFSGADVPFAVEVAFRAGGTLTGGRDLGTGAVELDEGHAAYRVGRDEIIVGPGHGSGPDRPPVYHPGEAYTFLGGTDALTGPRVYLTGRTTESMAVTIRGTSV
ncbi:hypothetical protein [Ruania alba]|uniref:Heparinase II/III-like protein n=1 Tax=Ruania alba TaxID=648782 RepID=A0A1H5NES3_9MICO|nr:hypothetical protein [Ruania alba]SEF00172.1 hypothetical protein SAMN04488554_4272 [Ruania alba]